jgi:CRP-like cAMP-binding protein/small-conductance mechanosensitive channel
VKIFRQLLSAKFLLIIAINILAAVAAATWLGDSIGWMAPGRAKVGGLLGNGLPLLQFAALAAFIDRLMWGLARQESHQKSETRVPRLALQLGTFVIYTTITAVSINLVFNQSMTGILGASGVIGLVLGFALRGLVSDVFSGIALQLDRSINANEWMDFQYRGREISAKLLELSWRTAIFADRCDNLILVPNGEFASLLVTNRSRPTHWSEYGSGIDLGAEHDQAHILAILQNAVNKSAFELLGEMQTDPPPYIRISSVKEGGINFRILYNVNVSTASPTKVNHVVLTNALQFLKAAGIPVTRIQHTDISPHAEVGQHHIDQPQARLSILSSVRFLSILPPADLNTVAADVDTFRIQKGHQLLVAGDTGDSMFVVSEGSLIVTIDTPQGPATVARLWPGDCIGEMSLLTGEARSANVWTCEPTVLFQIRKETMAGIFENNPALVVRIAEMVEARNKSNQSALTQPTETTTSETTGTGILESIRRFFRL